MYNIERNKTLQFNDTLKEILQNFAAINQSIIFKAGDVVSTMSPMKQVIAKAKSPVSFPTTFAVYSLGSFLSTISLFKEPEMNFTDKSVFISGLNPEGKREEIRFNFTEPSLVIAPPEKELKMPEPDVEFNLSNAALTRALKVANVIEAPEMAVAGDGEKIYLQALNMKNSADNNYKVEVGETSKNFRLVFSISNLNILPRDYEVKISAKGLSHFKASDVEYWIAVESTSTFEG